MKKLTHLNEAGDAHMVDVNAKPVQKRLAVAEGSIHGEAATIRLLKAQGLPKGDVLAVARIAGIQGAKQTAQLIPLCHPLPLQHLSIDFKLLRTEIRIRCEVSTESKTGVEMEALTGVSVAALTLYDMLKAVDKSLHIEGIRLVKKVKQ